MRKWKYFIFVFLCLALLYAPLPSESSNVIITAQDWEQLKANFQTLKTENENRMNLLTELQTANDEQTRQLQTLKKLLNEQTETIKREKIKMLCSGVFVGFMAGVLTAVISH